MHCYCCVCTPALCAHGFSPLSSPPDTTQADRETVTHGQACKQNTHVQIDTDAEDRQASTDRHRHRLTNEDKHRHIHRHTRTRSGIYTHIIDTGTPPQRATKTQDTYPQAKRRNTPQRGTRRGSTSHTLDHKTHQRTDAHKHKHITDAHLDGGLNFSASSSKTPKAFSTPCLLYTSDAADE